jgi:hypothetical protein
MYLMIKKNKKSPRRYMSTQYLSQLNIPQENINVRVNSLEANTIVYPSTQVAFTLDGLDGAGSSHAIDFTREYDFSGSAQDGNMVLFTVDEFDISGLTAVNKIPLQWLGPTKRPATGSASTTVAVIDSNDVYHLGTFQHYENDIDSTIHLQTTTSGDCVVPSFSVVFYGK